MKPQYDLMRCVFGSHLYGTSTPSSDRDFKSVHVPSGEDILLQRVKPVYSKKTKVDSLQKNTAEDVDEESISIGKYLWMVENGDTMGLELLYVPDSCLLHVSPEWNWVLSHRPYLVNAQCKGFVAYCQRQAAKYGIKGSRVAAVRAAADLLTLSFERLGPNVRLSAIAEDVEKFVERHEHTSIQDVELRAQGKTIKHWEICGRKLPYTASIKECMLVAKNVFANYGERALQAETNQGVDWKAVSHAMRVAQQAIEILQTGMITFPRPNAEELRDIKLGKFEYKEIAVRLESLLEDVEVAARRSTLRASTDTEVLHNIVRQLHYNQVV